MLYGINDMPFIKRIIYFALAVLSLTVLVSCKSNINNEISSKPADYIEISAQSSEETPGESIIEVTETPAPSIEFSFENIFKEIFSDEAISKLYPGKADCEKERTRIYNNISRIEDFVFYELTEEEQSFLKEAYQGNVVESDEAQLRGVLTKILQNDPTVFDDVDNEVKLKNRAEYFLPKFADVGENLSDYPNFGVKNIREHLIIYNCGNLEGIGKNAVTDYINIGMNAAIGYNRGYFKFTVLPDFKNNKWKGNYGVYPIQYQFLDGSEAQKMTQKLFDLNVKLFTSDRKNINDVLEEIVNLFTDYLLINDALKKPEGIHRLDSPVHTIIIYRYCKYLCFTVNQAMNPNLKYTFPGEYVKSVGLPSSKMSFKDLRFYIESYTRPDSVLYNIALEELENAQSKYGHPDFKLNQIRQLYGY